MLHPDRTRPGATAELSHRATAGLFDGPRSGRPTGLPPRGHAGSEHRPGPGRHHHTARAHLPSSWTARRCRLARADAPVPSLDPKRRRLRAGQPAHIQTTHGPSCRSVKPDRSATAPGARGIGERARRHRARKRRAMGPGLGVCRPTPGLASRLPASPHATRLTPSLPSGGAARSTPSRSTSPRPCPTLEAASRPAPTAPPTVVPLTRNR